MGSKSVIVPILWCLGPAMFCVSATLATGGVPQDGRKATEMPKQIQDERKRGIGFLAYSPKLHVLASVPLLYNFNPKSPPSFPIDTWDLPSGQFKRQLVGHVGNIKYIGFMPDGEKLFSAGRDGLFLWDLVKMEGDKGPFKSFADWAMLTPSGKEVVRWDEAGGIVFWDAKTAEKKRVVAIPAEARKDIKSIGSASLAISSDERYMALGTGLRNNAIIVFDFKSGVVKTVLTHGVSLEKLASQNLVVTCLPMAMRFAMWFGEMGCLIFGTLSHGNLFVKSKLRNGRYGPS